MGVPETVALIALMNLVPNQPEAQVTQAKPHPTMHVQKNNQPTRQRCAPSTPKGKKKHNRR